MVDGCHYGKNVKSPYFRNRLTAFDEIWHGDTLAINDHQNSEFMKIKDGGGRHLDNYENCGISAMARPTITTFGMLMQNGSVNHPTIKI